MASTALDESGDAEVGEQRARFGYGPLKEDVLKFEISVNHPRLARRVGDVGSDSNDRVGWEALLPGIVVVEASRPEGSP